MQNADTVFTDPETHWLVRLYLRLIRRFRPDLGWAVLVTLCLLAILPGQAIDIHDWIRVQRLQNMLVVAGPLAALTGWLLLGWRHWRPSNRSWWRLLLLFLVSELIGLAVLSQLFIRWIPGIVETVRSLARGTYFALWSDALAKLLASGTRYSLWWQGVQGGGAAQDDLVFAGLVGLLIWTCVLLSVYIARRYRRGLFASFPLLWLTTLPLIFSREGKFYLVLGLVLALLLHLVLDQDRLRGRWRSRGWDFSDDLMIDRLVAVAGATAFILTVAVVTPSVAVRPIADWYFRLVSPVDARLDDVSDRLFPDLKGSRRFVGLGVSGGLPNEFLLSAGPDLSDAVVMQVRTSDVVMDYPYESAPPPPGHYMRGATFADYNGRGWGNDKTVRAEEAANQRWIEPPWIGRRPLVQSVNLTFLSNVLYAAPEPVEPAVDYRTELRSAGDLVAIFARSQSYTIASLVPALSTEQLEQAAPVDLATLPEEYAAHLLLPESVTQRTRELASELVDGLETPYAMAREIERYLRTYEYDLTVPSLPADVVDVADYFLFDLERGYCDYYATAFVVLARLNGLPTRFATGFAVGRWDGYDLTWTISEAEAHSWPEVYFPEYGWIAFEPTVGRAELDRIGLPVPPSSVDFSPGLPTVEPITSDGFGWNWQMLFWLLPLGLAIWGGWAWANAILARRRDPWHSILRWGQRIGRPMADGETTSEYGHGLALFLVSHQRGEPGTIRYVAGEIESMSRDVTQFRYGPTGDRSEVIHRVEERWAVLRGYLWRVKIGK